MQVNTVREKMKNIFLENIYTCVCVCVCVFNIINIFF